MRAQTEKMNGLNLNPLAPAKSKRTFPFSGKIEIPMKMHPFQVPFSILFCNLFKPFAEKSQKGSRVRPQSRKKTLKWIPRGPTGSPRINKLSLKVPPSTKNTVHFPPRVAKMEPQVLQWIPRAPPSARKAQHGPQKC